MGGQASIENGKLGGRPSGRRNNATLARKFELERLRQRIFETTDVLVNAQLSLSRGASLFFKADTDNEPMHGLGGGALELSEVVS